MQTDAIDRPPWSELATERLMLRRPRPSDAGAMTLYCGDRRVAEMTTSIPHPYLPEMAASFIEQVLDGRHRERIWVMDGSSTGSSELIGVVGFKPDLCEIGYWVGPPFWLTGYATEAVMEVCRHLLEDMRLPVVRASVFTDNPASQQVLHKAGFAEVGATNLHSIARGGTVPAVRFELGSA